MKTTTAAINLGDTVTLWHPLHNTTGRVVAFGRKAGLPVATVLVEGRRVTMYTKDLYRP